jgi:disulfide bond formation protein DsbB
VASGSPAAVRLARLIALVTPALLLGGAYVGQYAFGLFPCEMCWWQRYAHFAALALALAAHAFPRSRVPVALAGLAIAVAGVIGGFHAGVELHWWQGITACSTVIQPGGDPLEAIMNAPLVRCDTAPWDLFGVSLAGWNFLFSLAAALAILLLLRQTKRPR